MRKNARDSLHSAFCREESHPHSSIPSEALAGKANFLQPSTALSISLRHRHAKGDAYRERSGLDLTQVHELLPLRYETGVIGWADGTVFFAALLSSGVRLRL
jgi:hypothetical protein